MTTSAALDALFASMRRGASARGFSRGVELGRSGAVRSLDEQRGEIVARVRVAGRPVAPTVVLYPDDDSWSCDCDSSDDACEHAIAAVIACRKLVAAGGALRVAESGDAPDGEGAPLARSPVARLGYRFSRRGDKLALERVVVRGASESPLALSLASAAARDEAEVEPTYGDMQAERLLATLRLAALPADRVVLFMELLADAADVKLDGEPIRISSAPAVPRAELAERGKRLVLTLRRPERAEAVIPGLALVRPSPDALAGTLPELRPVGAMDVGGSRFELLPSERVFGPDRVSELVGERLPALERAGVEIELQTERLERRFVELAPRIVVEVAQEGAALSVLPAIVYGDPPCARVDAGKLVHLRGPIPRRDEPAERRLASLLDTELELSAGKRKLVMGDEAAAFAARLRHVAARAAEGRGRAAAFAIEGDAHLELYPDRPLVAHVAVGADGKLALRFTAAAAGATADGGRPERAADEGLGADPARVLEAWRRGELLVALDGGGWAPIPSDFLARHGQRLAELMAARDADGRIEPAARPALLALCDELEAPRPASLAHLAPLVDGFEGLPEAALPSDLRAELRPYQKRAVDWLVFLRSARLGAVLADDMGLGKTLEVLCTLRRGERALVVCPTSVVHNWAAEIARFRPALRCGHYAGKDRRLDPALDVVVTSYAILRLDADLLAAERFGVCVLDEAQAIKNPDSQVARAAYRLDAETRIALSGTPIENRLEELWSVLHFANPGLLGGRSAFEAVYARPIEEGDPRALERLRAKVRPFVLRRTKREVLADLPPKTESVLVCELDETERAVYDTVLAATREELVAALAPAASGETGKAPSTLAVLEALLRLRQAACHAALVPGQRAARSSKVDALCDALGDASADGHKALVFSQWTSLLDLVEPALTAFGVDFVRLDGSTRDRAGVVARFQDTSGPPVMLVSLKAGGTGLNLTAADHVFLLDPWWNPAVEQQATDRAHRIGQEHPVNVYRLVAKDTIEERVLALGDKKRALAAAALDGAGHAATLGRDDLLALLA